MISRGSLCPCVFLLSSISKNSSLEGTVDDETEVERAVKVGTSRTLANKKFEILKTWLLKRLENQKDISVFVHLTFEHFKSIFNKKELEHINRSCHWYPNYQKHNKILKKRKQTG